MFESKKTIVLGASPDPLKRAHRVCTKLMEKGHDVLPVGIKEGVIGDQAIITSSENVCEVHTVVIFIRAARQEQWLDYILACKPKRIIFNPGSENDNLIRMALDNGIEVLHECTILMLSSNRF